MASRLKLCIIRCLCAMTFATLILFSASAKDRRDDPGHDHAHDHGGSQANEVLSQFEPTVTEAEAQLLGRLSGLSGNDRAAAIEELKAAIHEGSGPALYFALGCYCHDDGRSNEAIAAFRKALGGMPLFHRARMNLASIHLQEADFKAALKELAALIDYNAPNKGRVWGMMAYAHLSMGNAAAAETAYRNAQVFMPDDSEIRIGLIKSLLDQGELEKTCALIKSELAKDPYQGELWSLSANAFLTSNQYLEALVQIECARRLGLIDSESLLTLGDLLLDQGLYFEAVDLFKSVSTLNDADLGRLLGVVEGFIYQNRLEDAEELLALFDDNDRSLTQAERGDVMLMRARLFEAQGDSSRAFDLYKDLLAENPLNGEALMAAGNILRKRGDLEKALIHYQRAERTSPDHKAMALVRQAQVAVEREEYSQAVKWLKQSLELDRQPHVERYLEQVERLVSRP